MKISEIKKQYGFKQSTFYDWLRETGMIKKEDTGYIAGDNAINGMSTLKSEFKNEHGNVITRTQVVVENENVLELVELYKNSGRENLYAEISSSKDIEELKAKLDEINWKVDALSSQINFLTEQLKMTITYIRKR